jgi:hypothetical protein
MTASVDEREDGAAVSARRNPTSAQRECEQPDDAVFLCRRARRQFPDGRRSARSHISGFGRLRSRPPWIVRHDSDHALGVLLVLPRGGDVLGYFFVVVPAGSSLTGGEVHGATFRAIREWWWLVGCDHALGVLLVLPRGGDVLGVGVVEIDVDLLLGDEGVPLCRQFRAANDCPPRPQLQLPGQLGLYLLPPIEPWAFCSFFHEVAMSWVSAL